MQCSSCEEVMRRSRNLTLLDDISKLVEKSAVEEAFAEDRKELWRK
jgi:hypothetical protein